MPIYTHNPKKKNHCYHIATPSGTLCRMENSSNYRAQRRVNEPPAGKSLCSMCSDMHAKYGDVPDEKFAARANKRYKFALGTHSVGYINADDPRVRIENGCLVIKDNGVTFYYSQYAEEITNDKR